MACYKPIEGNSFWLGIWDGDFIGTRQEWSCTKCPFSLNSDVHVNVESQWEDWRELVLSNLCDSASSLISIHNYRLHLGNNLETEGSLLLLRLGKCLVGIIIKQAFTETEKGSVLAKNTVSSCSLYHWTHRENMAVNLGWKFVSSFRYGA